MDFGKKLLEKYGWEKGKGLGKNEDGIANAIKPQLKFDKLGIGHKPGDEFTNNWWERVFNSASSNIDVQVDNGNIKIKKNRPQSVEITTKNYSVEELNNNKNLQYGSFLKTSKLTQDGIESYNVTAPEPFASTSCLTDEELLAACGGRTAHKGARHGIKMSGKLARIEKQEKMLLKKMKNMSLSDCATADLEKKMKKLEIEKESIPEVKQLDSKSKKKNKKKGHVTYKCKNKSRDTQKCILDKNKNKKERKSVSFNDETTIMFYTPDLDSSKDESTNDQASSDSDTCNDGSNREKETEDEITDITTVENPENISIIPVSEVYEHCIDLSKPERKKLKKKRKLHMEDSNVPQDSEEDILLCKVKKVKRNVFEINFSSNEELGRVNNKKYLLKLKKTRKHKKSKDDKNMSKIFEILKEQSKKETSKKGKFSESSVTTNRMVE